MTAPARLAATPERPAFSRRGACPALSAPMQTGDGLLVRLNPVARGLSPKTLIGLCESALAHGNGVVEVTARGSFQIRGLSAASADALAADIDALAIDVRAGVPVETSALAGLDPDEITDPRPLADAIRARIAADGLSLRLGPKVSVVVDGGGHSGLGGVSADMRLTAQAPGLWRVAIAGDAAGARLVGVFEASGACEVVIVLLESIAAKGLSARANDIPVDSIKVNAVECADQIGPSSPCRDLLPVNGEKGIGRNITASPSPRLFTGRRSRQGDEGQRDVSAGTIIPLANACHALPIALPFGSIEAQTLIALAQTAEASGANEFRLAPGRTVLALCPSPATADRLKDTARALGFIVSPLDPRARIAACPGKPACASGVIAAREIARSVADAFADMAGAQNHQTDTDAPTETKLDPFADLSIHISGCAKGCARQASAAITIVGGENGAGLVVAGTAKDAPTAYTAGDNAAGAVKRVLRLAGSERRRSETADACLARLGRAKLGLAFRQDGA